MAGKTHPAALLEEICNLLVGVEEQGAWYCQDVSVRSDVSGMSCARARSVVSRSHATPAGWRHPARTMKHMKVSDFLRPVAGRYPRNAMEI